jgi:uncharacterized protein
VERCAEPAVLCRVLAFYATRAVLAIRNLDSSRHSGVIALFQQHFVKTGAVPLDVARALPRAFESPQSSDYTDTADPTADEVRVLSTDIEAFIDACAHLVERTTSHTES